MNFQKIESGLSRPQGSAGDIGAYEYIEGPRVLYSDVTGDSVVSAYDVALVVPSAVGLVRFNSSQTRAGDVSGDGAISPYDAALTAQKAVGLITIPC
jgi:hypothetical protein